jgi:hypothetical protein
MESMSDPTIPDIFNYEQEETTFVKTFKILESALSDEAFSYANKARTKLTGGFSVYHYEAFTIGLQKCIDRVEIDEQEQITKLAGILRDIKLNEEFITITTGGGKNSPGPLNDRIKFVQDRVYI